MNGGPPHSPDDLAAARAAMVRDQIEARGIHDRPTLAAMSLVQREAFVRSDRTVDAYADGPLSIGHGQTISQPYMVARMTASLGLEDLGWPWHGARPSVLDVGTGSGYQAAVLAQCGARVTSVERDPDLAAWARENLRRQGYDVEVQVGDGSVGFPANAPYIAIVVGAGAPAVPTPLKEQLADGGRLVVPVGDRRRQRLVIIERRGHLFDERSADPCVFVPLVGRHGHPG